jgi:hypothetical protein
LFSMSYHSYVKHWGPAIVILAGPQCCYDRGTLVGAFKVAVLLRVRTTRTIGIWALIQEAAGWAKSPTCVFTSNGLVVRPESGQAYLCLAPTSSLGDLAASVTVQQKSGASNQAFGIAFHHIAPKNYYFFGIDGRGHFTATVVVNDVKHVVIPFTSNAAIHTGTNATNRLQVIAKGQTMTFLVNSVAVGQATLSTFATGTVGLRGISDGEVVFQQLSISSV